MATGDPPAILRLCSIGQFQIGVKLALKLQGFCFTPCHNKTRWSPRKKNSFPAKYAQKIMYFRPSVVEFQNAPYVEHKASIRRPESFPEAQFSLTSCMCEPNDALLPDDNTTIGIQERKVASLALPPRNS
jgi:hypothetical protein